MLKYIFLLLVFTSIYAQIIPQVEPIENEEPTKDEPVMFEEPKPLWKQKMHYGGNLWLGFWGAFYIDASPMVGYDISEKGTVAGVGASFIYNGTFNQGGNLAAGGRIFIRQAVWKSIFLHGEYELMNAQSSSFYTYDFNDPNNINKPITRKWGGSPLIGAGFYQGGGGQQKGSFISVMYNLGYPTFGYISPQGLGGNNSPIVLRFGYFF